MPLAVQIVLTVLLGVVTGILSATVGVGGAVISTPGIRAFGATPLEGVGSTLPSILPSAITGVLRYHRERLIEWGVVKRVVPFGVLAAVAGAIASVHFPGKGHVQMIMTAALVGYTAWKTSRPPRPLPAATAGESPPRPMADSLWVCGIIGACSGALSGFLGVGGGIFMVPTFRGWLKLGLKPTVATSLACVGMLAIPSTLTHIAEGTINWTFALPLCVGVIPGAKLGAHWTVAASDRQLRLWIGIGLGLMATVYGIAEIIAVA